MMLDPLTDTQGSLPQPLRPIWDQLRQRSITTINEGLEAFSKLAEESPAIADHIFDSVGVSPRPSSRSAIAALIRGSRFSRVDREADLHLLYALLGLLSRAPIRSRGAELRQSIQWLDLECPAIPELQGFVGLMELKLSIWHPYGSQDKPHPYSFSDRIAPFPCLEKLELNVSGGGSEFRIESLDWLPAPVLKVLKASDVGLSSIEGLREINTLETVDLSRNGSLSDLSPLSNSANTLRSLDLFRTGIDGLAGIAGLKQLNELNINDCPQITSLESLREITIDQKWLGLSRLKGLASLNPFPQFTGERLDFTDLPLITHLDGLESATELRSIVINNLPALADASALQRLSGLQEVTISECGALASLQGLDTLPSLVKIRIWECANLHQLPATWPTTLRFLHIGNCAITEIGQLPIDLDGELDLSDCPDLQTLRGLEGCSKLASIRVGPQPRDLSAMAKLPNTWLCVDFQHDNKHWQFTDPLIDALAALPACKLRIMRMRNPENWDLKASDLAPLNHIPHLKALDISDLDVDGVAFVMGLEELEVLKVAPRSELSKALGGCTFDSATEIAKLKLSLLGMG